MKVYHGTKKPKDLSIRGQYVSPKKKGKMQNGSGLYTTCSLEVAKVYGKVIGLELDLKEEEDSQNVLISVNDILKFSYGVFSKRNNEEFKRLLNKRIDVLKIQGKNYEKIDAKTFQDFLLITDPDKFHNISQDVNDFLILNNAKYSVDFYDGNTMILIHDFRVITRKIDILEALDITKEDLIFSYSKKEDPIKENKIENIKKVKP